MPGTDHFAIDPLQQFGGKQAQVVLDRLKLVEVLLAVGPTGMPKHLAKGLVLVGQLVQPVVVGIEPQAQHAQHQDLPLLHAWAPGARIGLAIASHRDDFFEDGEHPRPQVRGGVNVLQSAQQLRNVVAGLGVEHDGGDVLLAELQLRVDDLAHGVSNDEVYWILFGSGGGRPESPSVPFARIA